MGVERGSDVDAVRRLLRGQLPTLEDTTTSEANAVYALMLALWDTRISKGKWVIGAPSHFAADMVYELESLGWKLVRQTKEEHQQLLERRRSKSNVPIE